MIDKGLLKAGYNTIVLDACWFDHTQRDESEDKMCAFPRPRTYPTPQPPTHPPHSHHRRRAVIPGAQHGLVL